MITKLRQISHSAMQSVKVFPFSQNAKRGVPQSVLVQVDPGGTIPLHVHEVDARMYCVSGQASVLSDNAKDNGVSVSAGDLVEFKAGVGHGFKVGEKGFSFISENGGIVDQGGNWDIAFSS